ncbi:MAG: hypothetical protein GXO03_04020 [Aquificae bacterium]|nr:hypothetical protein [Aquificota bacterium]
MKLKVTAHLPAPLPPFLPFFLFFLLSLFLQFATPWLVGYDAYFHVKFAYLHREDFFIDELPWLWHTIHREEFRNHHLLFHYLLFPFTLLGDLNFWGKVAAALFLAIAWQFFYLILRAAGVKWALLWSLIGFSASHAFLFRLSMLRIQSLSLAVLLALFYFAYRRNYKALFFTSLLFVYLYDGFPLALFVALAFTVSDFITEKKKEWRYLASTALGILTGMIINPYFPENFSSFVFNVYRTIFLDKKEAGVKLGIEWYPYSSWGLLENMLLAFVALAALFLFLPFAGRPKREELASIILSLGFLFLAFKSRRFVEYAPAFVMLSFILVLVRRLKPKEALALALLLAPLSVYHFLEARKTVARAPSPKPYEKAAEWLKNNTPPRSLVFNADWDDFPFLFYYNHHNYYTVGLDPMYMYRYDPKLYRLYQQITKGKVKRPARLIAERFGASYVFTDKKHRRLIKNLELDPYAKKVYEDRFAVIYEVKASSRDAPADAQKKKGR